MLADPVIYLDDTTTLYITVTNINTATITGAAFADSLAALAQTMVAGTVSVSGVGCVGVATNSATTVTWTGGEIPSFASCTFSVVVQGVLEGTSTNAPFDVTSTNAAPGTSNAADLVVVANLMNE